MAVNKNRTYATLADLENVASGVTTITKSLTLKTDWQDTGIAGTNLATGSYIVQVTHATQGYGSLWSEHFTGFMSWYSGGTNSSESDEILLHKAGHAPNNAHIYLRVLRQPGSSGGICKLQIAFTSTLTTADNITFKFKRLI